MATDNGGRTGPQLERAVQGEDVEVRMAGIGLLRAEHAELTNAGAGLVLAGGEVAIARGGARTIVAEGPVSISQGGAGTILGMGEVHIEQGGSGMLLARHATVGRGGFVALAIAPRVEVAEGGRVLIGLREVAALGLILAAIATLGRVLGRGD